MASGQHPDRDFHPGPTVDPFVVIEEIEQGYTRYRDELTGRRWEVYGVCDRRGDCLIGTTIEGFGEIGNLQDIERAKIKLGKERIDSELDVPVTPEFNLCCGSELFSYVELEPDR